MQGGVSAVQIGAFCPTAPHPVPISALLSVSEEAVLALFGMPRTAALRMPPTSLPPALKTSMRGQKQRVRWPCPKNVFEPIFFSYFQQDHALLLRFLPPDLAKN